MPSLQSLKTRKTSLQSTRKVTKVMQMISSSRLRKVQDRLKAAKEPCDLLLNMCKKIENEHYPNWARKIIDEKDQGGTLLVVMSSNRGLCGPFNTNIYKKSCHIIDEISSKGNTVEIICTGNKCSQTLGKKYGDQAVHSIPTGNDVDIELANNLATEVIQRLQKGNFTKFYVCYSNFKNILTQEAVVESVLFPKNDYSQNDQEDIVKHPFETEGDPTEIAEVALRNYLISYFMKSLLNSATSEHASRMTAMDGATKNASDLIDKITTMYNKCRQAKITTELIEIISGMSSLESNNNK